MKQPALSSVPLQGTGPVLGDLPIEEVLLVRQVGGLRLPGKGVLSLTKLGHPDALEPFVGGVLDVVSDLVELIARIPSGRASRAQSFSRVTVSRISAEISVLEPVRPNIRIPELDRIDEVSTECKVETLVVHDVFGLLSDSDHLVAALQGEHHRNFCIEEDPLHDYVAVDQVVDEGAAVLLALSGEDRVEETGPRMEETPGEGVTNEAVSAGP